MIRLYIAFSYIAFVVFCIFLNFSYVAFLEYLHSVFIYLVYLVYLILFSYIHSFLMVSYSDSGIWKTSQINILIGSIAYKLCWAKMSNLFLTYDQIYTHNLTRSDKERFSIYSQLILVSISLVAKSIHITPKI